MPGRRQPVVLIDFQSALVYTLARPDRCLEVPPVAISDETLKAMIRDYHGFELTDAELALIRPELDSYLEELEKLRDMDLSGVMSARLLHADEGREHDVRH